MGKHTSIVERLKGEIRNGERRGLTRYRLAQVSGVSEGQLSRIVKGKIVPKLDTAQRIVRGLGRRMFIGPAD